MENIRRSITVNLMWYSINLFLYQRHNKIDRMCVYLCGPIKICVHYVTVANRISVRHRISYRPMSAKDIGYTI